jgi:hypothetical protein
MLIETVYQYVAAEDRSSAISTTSLFCSCTLIPMAWIWYRTIMRKEPTNAGLGVRLYQKYVGHDNNRDFYANTQAETKNSTASCREWIRRSCSTTINRARRHCPPPFRDPFNYNCDPLVISGRRQRRDASASRRGKPAATVRSGPYSTVVQWRTAHDVFLPITSSASDGDYRRPNPIQSLSRKTLAARLPRRYPSSGGFPPIREYR